MGYPAPLPPAVRPVPLRPASDPTPDPDLPDPEIAWVAERMLADLCGAYMAARVKVGPLLDCVRRHRGLSRRQMALAVGISGPGLNAVLGGAFPPGPEAIERVALWLAGLPVPPKRAYRKRTAAMTAG